MIGRETLAKYLVLIYGNPQTWADAPPEWHAANATRHQALIAAAGRAVVGVTELEPTARAVSIRADASGSPVATNGPFVDAPEVIGGYSVLDVPDLEEAIRLAGLIPEATATHGGVEIRPIASP
jgi:hypothetical protein